MDLRRILDCDESNNFQKKHMVAYKNNLFLFLNNPIFLNKRCINLKLMSHFEFGQLHFYKKKDNTPIK